jgi:predicted DNA-binding transcriptional regulator AlpA
MEQFDRGGVKRKISVDELVTITDLEIFKTQLIREIKSLFSKNGRPIKRWLKSNEVRDILGVSHGTLQTMRNSGEIPFTKMGGTLYYDQDEIDDCFAKRKKVKR